MLISLSFQDIHLISEEIRINCERCINEDVAELERMKVKEVRFRYILQERVMRCLIGWKAENEKERECGGRNAYR